MPANPVTGRPNNQGLKELTSSADKKTPHALMQSALVQGGGCNSSTRYLARLLEYDVSDLLVRFTRPDTLSHSLSLTTTLLSLLSLRSTISARPNSLHLPATLLAITVRITPFLTTATSMFSTFPSPPTSQATHTISITCAVATVNGVLTSSIILATYHSWLDFYVNSRLNRFGLHNRGPQDAGLLMEKWESIAMAPVNPANPTCKDGYTKSDGEYFIFSLNDSDFITQNGYLNSGQFQYIDESAYNLDNQVLVFKVTIPTD